MKSLKTVFGLGVLGLAALMPIAANAQLENIERIVSSIGSIVDVATPIIVGIALLAFFWGLAKFIFSAGNEDAKDEGKRIMIWGVVALFVIISIWGIVSFIGEAIGINPEARPEVVPGI